MLLKLCVGTKDWNVFGDYFLLISEMMECGYVVFTLSYQYIRSDSKLTRFKRVVTQHKVKSSLSKHELGHPISSNDKLFLHFKLFPMNAFIKRLEIVDHESMLFRCYVMVRMCFLGTN